jgi:cold shock CspA family protein
VAGWYISAPPPRGTLRGLAAAVLSEKDGGGIVACGRVRWFSEEKGYGFIEDEESGEVEFEIEEGRRGRKQAYRVEVAG